MRSHASLRTPLLLIALVSMVSLLTAKPGDQCFGAEHRSPVFLQLKKLQIVSFASDQEHCMLKLLMKSSPYPIEVLGKNTKWRGHRYKQEAVKNYIARKNLRHSNQIIMFVDGYDTFFQPGNQDIIKKFEMFDTPIIFSAETNCWPPHTPACTHLASYPQSPTKFRYLNAGTYIGYASAIYRMLTEILKENPNQMDDQYMLHDYFIKHPDKVSLDYKQEIFSLLYGTNAKDYHYDDKTGFIMNNSTHTTPIVFHGNGGPLFKALLLDLYVQAYPNGGACPKANGFPLSRE